MLINKDKKPVFSFYKNQLIAATTSVLKLCRDGSNVRFFSRCHPLHALKNWRDACGRRPTVDLCDVTINSFKHSYVYEMICLLVPRFRDWDIINSLFSEVDFKIGSREYPIGFPVNKMNVRQLQTNHQ